MQDGAVRETGAPAGGGHGDHDHTVFCEAGRSVYARALTEGRVPRAAAGPAPCLLDAGLLHDDPDDTASLRPAMPLVALPRLLGDIEAGIARHRDRASRLAAAFEPFLRLEDSAGPGTGPGAGPGAGLAAESATEPGAPFADPGTTHVTVLKGMPRIRRAVRQALADASDEILGIQPSDPGREPMLPHDEPWRLAEFAARGGRMRTLSRPQTTRDTLPARAHPDRPSIACEVRTLDEVPPCLLVFDRDVAFIPAADDGRVAFELRSQALITYVGSAFDVLWRLASPVYREDAPPPPDQAVGPIQRIIAGLLTQGLTDTEIAGRLGMNVRTVRVHIAKLAATLGSGSRTQLGFLISRSGLLDRQR